MLAQYRGEESILVADDEPVVLSLAQTILGRYGYRVFTAKNGQEALKIHEQCPPLDLVLTDVIMPEMTGPELIHAIKLQEERMRCVFMSGYDHAHIEKQGVRGLGCDYLRKPFTPEALLKKIRQTLDSDASN